jgi:hypothetical protein
MRMNDAQNLEFAGSVGGARALIESFSAAGSAATVEMSLGFAAQFDKIVKLGQTVLRGMTWILDLPDEEQTDDLLYQALICATWVVESLGGLIEEGAQLVEAGRIPTSFWPEDVVSRLRQMVEEFEDVQEAVGLGLSDEFRKQLESAKAEALR